MAQNVGKIIEYRDVPDGSMARTTVLETATTYKREYRLSQSTEGYECAGSMARWTNPYYSVTFEVGGSINGRRFLTESEARTMLEKWVAKDNEDDAILREQESNYNRMIGESLRRY